MDPNEKSGSKWPKLPPLGKLEILRRYRDQSLKRDSHFLTANDNFIAALAAEGLEAVYIEDIALNNRM
jgi:hypothetical protein